MAGTSNAFAALDLVPEEKQPRVKAPEIAINIVELDGLVRAVTCSAFCESHGHAARPSCVMSAFSACRWYSRSSSTASKRCLAL